MSNQANGFLWYWLFATLVVLFLTFLWAMSPLGIGFQIVPENEVLATLLLSAYHASFFIGIPALLIAHIASGLFGFYGKQKLGFRLSFWSIIIFTTSIVAISSLFI